MQEYVKQINEFIDARKDEIVETWKEIVSMDSFKNNKEGCNAVARRLAELFGEEGFQCRTIEVGPQSGDVLVGILGADRPGKPVIFGGHLDTVFETADFETPFRIEDGKAYGPGVLDMKGGIIIALYAIKALNSLGWNERPIKILFAGDEEKLHQNAPTAQYFKDECSGALCEFNMETGLMDGDLCIARNGKTEAHIMIEGVEAHAGNDYYSGRNAIAEMAHKILDFQNLTNKEVGTTVNTGVISGGTMSGAVPKHCEAFLDLRASRVCDMEMLKKQVEETCKKTYIDGTATTMEYTMEMLPFETNDEVNRLFQFVQNIARENGYGDFGCKALGGSSDASYATIAGIPAVCSCGVRGQWNHTVREYAVVDSMFERAKLWAAVVYNIAAFEK